MAETAMSTRRTWTADSRALKSRKSYSSYAGPWSSRTRFARSMSKPTIVSLGSRHSKGGKGVFVPMRIFEGAGGAKNTPPSPRPPRNAMIATITTVTTNTILLTPPRTASGGGAPDCAIAAAMAPSIYNHSSAGTSGGLRRGPRDARLDDVEPRIQELVGDVQGGDVPDPALPAREHDDPVLVQVLHDRVPALRVRCLSLRLGHELRDPHQAKPAVVPDDRELVLHLVEAGRHPFSQPRRVRDELLLLDHVEGRDRGRARHGVAAERVAVGPGDAEVELRVEHRGADRDSAPERLREGEDVRHHAFVLHSEHPPRPSESRLDLVRDQEEVVVLRDLRDPGKPPLGGDDVPALSLDGLHEDPRGVPWGSDRVHVQVLDDVRAVQVAARVLELVRAPIAVGERYMDDPGHCGKEPLLLHLLARGEGEGAHRASVERPEEREEHPPPRAPLRDLDRGLVRLRPAVREEHLLRRLPGGELREPLREPRLDVVVEVRPREVAELAHLFPDRVDDLRVAVTHVHDGDAAAEVDVRVPVDVLNHGPEGPFRDDRGGLRARRQEPPIPLDDVPGFGSGRGDLDRRDLHTNTGGVLAGAA